MKRSTIIEAAVQQPEPVESGLVRLAELAAEGLGWGEHTTSPRDAVDALARQLGELVVLDDIGRHCVSRDTARALFAERAAADDRLAQRRRAAQERARRRPRPSRGVPAVDGMSAYESMIAASSSGEDERRKDRAAERTAALMRGESFGEIYALREE